MTLTLPATDDPWELARRALVHEPARAKAALAALAQALPSQEPWTEGLRAELEEVGRTLPGAMAEARGLLALGWLAATLEGSAQALEGAARRLEVERGPEARRLRAEACGRRAEVASLLADPELARLWAERAVDAARTLEVTGQLADALALARAYNTAASVAEQAGDLAAARAWHQHDLAALAAAPPHPAIRRAAAIAARNLSALVLDDPTASQAERQRATRQALDAVRAALNDEPDDPELQRELASALEEAALSAERDQRAPLLDEAISWWLRWPEDAQAEGNLAHLRALRAAS